MHVSIYRTRDQMTYGIEILAVEPFQCSQNRNTSRGIGVVLHSHIPYFPERDHSGFNINLSPYSRFHCCKLLGDLWIINTVFTWLNAAATISPVTKVYVATIQGRLLLEGGIYCTKHYYMRLLLKLNSNSKKFQVSCAIMSLP